VHCTQTKNTTGQKHAAAITAICVVWDYLRLSNRRGDMQLDYVCVRLEHTSPTSHSTFVMVSFFCSLHSFYISWFSFLLFLAIYQFLHLILPLLLSAWQSAVGRLPIGYITSLNHCRTRIASAGLNILLYCILSTARHKKSLWGSHFFCVFFIFRMAN